MTKHSALLELNGRKIEGLKRCSVCGLSETYWERFPSCNRMTDEEKKEHIFKRWGKVFARLASAPTPR